MKSNTKFNVFPPTSNRKSFKFIREFTGGWPIFTVSLSLSLSFIRSMCSTYCFQFRSNEMHYKMIGMQNISYPIKWPHFILKNISSTWMHLILLLIIVYLTWCALYTHVQTEKNWIRWKFNFARNFYSASVEKRRRVERGSFAHSHSLKMWHRWSKLTDILFGELRLIEYREY